jgi:RNA polymerase sigma-70 factor, ECF subfamily
MVLSARVAFLPPFTITSPRPANDLRDRGLSNAQLTAIYCQYGQRLLRRCRSRLGNLAAAEDAFQDVFLKIMRHGAAYTEASCKLSWLYRVAHNCCVDARGRQGDRPAPARLRDGDGDGAGPDPRPPLEDRLRVQRALGRLSDGDHQLAVLALVGGLSQTQIAAELGRSRQTINQRLGVIRQQLAGWLL